MHISVAKKRFARRLVGYVTNPVRSAVRTRTGREQTHVIAGHEVVLPPEHDLPFYQRRDPTYDTYAEALVAAIAERGPVLVVDLGANVGDTAVAMLGAHPDVRVVSAEGSDRFVDYLRRNTAAFGGRAAVVPAFVGPVGEHTTFHAGGSTGGFQRAHDDNRVEDATVTSWVSPAELLAHARAEEHVVWKSDIDGFDIHVLVEHWQTIDDRCDTLWFEYDPVGTLGDPADVDRLVDLLARSGRELDVYDNLGRRLVQLPPGEAVRTGLTSLTGWLRAQREGHLAVPYLDIWARRAR